MIPDDIIYLGYVEKPNGLKGGFTVRVFPWTGHPVIPPGTVILIGEIRSLTVTRCTLRGDSRINLTSEEIRNREDAKKLSGCSFFISRDEAERKLDFFPLYGFLGMEILSVGKSLPVVDIEPSGSNPLLLVEDAGNTFYVPLNLVMAEGNIDWKERLIELDLPEGLEDLSG